MKLHFHPEKELREVKKDFSALFPYLKIEFYSKGHKMQKGSPDQERLSDTTLLKEVNSQLKERSIKIDPLDPVGKFENFFQNELGLPIQIFRRAGELWLVTIQTDHLSLMKQNEMGKESVKTVRFNPITLFL